MNSFVTSRRFVIGFASVVTVVFPLATPPSAAVPTADQILQTLREGNARFVAGAPPHPNQSTARRTEIAARQTPFVTILTYSDSRLPVETIFDQGLGDLFVVRVADNVTKTDEIGSSSTAQVISTRLCSSCSATPSVARSKLSLRAHSSTAAAAILKPVRLA